VRDGGGRAHEGFWIGDAAHGVSNAVSDGVRLGVRGGAVDLDDGVSGADAFWAIQLLPATRRELGYLGVAGGTTADRIGLDAL